MSAGSGVFPIIVLSASGKRAHIPAIVPQGVRFFCIILPGRDE